MIGSHDTFTYLDSCNCLMNKLTRYWKTQCKSIEEQYAFGVRMFDIRVVRDSNKWRAAHGLAKLKKSWRSLHALCVYMDNRFPEAIYRLVLEKGNESQEEIFCRQATGLCKEFPNIWRIDIKSTKNWMGSVENNNDSLYSRGYLFAKVNTWESPSWEANAQLTVKNFWKFDMKKEDKKIHESLPFFQDKEELKKVIDSKENLYLLDYCTNEF